MPRPLTPIRGTVDRPLAARWYLARHVGCRPETVTRRCEPVACDVTNRALLYDVDASLAVLSTLRSLGPQVPAGRIT